MNFNRNENSDYDISETIELGDLKHLANGHSVAPEKDNMIRILRPRYGTIIAAYVSIVLKTAYNETSPRFRITAGTGFTASNSINPIIPTESEIAIIHRNLKGDDSYFENISGYPIVVEKLSILPTIPQFGNNWREDCFVVGVHFDKIPNNGTGYHLTKFTIEMSALIKE